MGKLSARKKIVKRNVVAPEAVGQMEDLDARMEAIQLLIPLGLEAVAAELQREVVILPDLGISARHRTNPCGGGAHSAGRCIWVIRSYRSMYRVCGMWPTTPRWPYAPIRLCRRHEKWMKVCCCEC